MTRAELLPGLVDLPEPVRCGACGCCPVDLCASAVEQGAPCFILAPSAGVDVYAAVRCPCAPSTCRCELPAHVRGIRRCRHYVPASGLVALGIGAVLLPATYRPRTGPAPFDRHCRRCGAGPGMYCRDLRTRAQTPPDRVRPHRERRLIGPPHRGETP